MRRVRWDVHRLAAAHDALLAAKRHFNLFGSAIREEILELIVALDRGAYAREIAALLERDLITVQRNLRVLEEDGVLASRTLDRVRLYELNRRYRYVRPLTELLREMAHDNQRIRGMLESIRQRPRRAGKELDAARS